MKFADAPTVGKLSAALLRFIEQHGPDCEWNGWDDESLILYPKGSPFVYISNKKEPDATDRDKDEQQANGEDHRTPDPDLQCG